MSTPYYSEEERDGQIITRVKPLSTKTPLGTNNFYLNKKGRDMVERGISEDEVIRMALEAGKAGAKQDKTQQRPRGPDDDIYGFYFG